MHARKIGLRRSRTPRLIDCPVWRQSNTTNKGFVCKRLCLNPVQNQPTVVGIHKQSSGRHGHHRDRCCEEVSQRQVAKHKRNIERNTMRDLLAASRMKVAYSPRQIYIVCSHKYSKKPRPNEIELLTFSNVRNPSSRARGTGWAIPCAWLRSAGQGGSGLALSEA